MITCRLNGRLGNNLFQIANGLSLATKLKTDLELPTITYAGHRGVITADLSMFGYKFIQVDDIEKELVYNEIDISYNEIQIQDNTLVSGYFSSWKYFEDIKQDLKNKYFIPSDSIRMRLLEYNIPENALGVSIRRGDFLMLQDNHCVLSVDYYQEVLNKYFQDNINAIYIFSDDIEWCKTVFGDSVNYVTDTIGTQLFLMTKMKHLILSNSTFAWWGAYLNQNDGIIVAPDPWLGPAHDNKDMSDLYYPSWILHKHNRIVHPYTVNETFFN